MRCRCGQKTVYFRRHEGRYYCKNCFIDQFEKNARKTIRQNELIKSKTRIAVALSGGKDSSALLYMLKKYENNFHIKLFAISIDEGIRGYREKSLEAAKKLTKQLNVEHHIFSFDDEFGIRLDNLKRRLKGKMNYCTYCGVLRRYLMNKKSRELGANKLAVGHNMDDEAQSILMNFLRGDFSQFQRLGANPTIIDDARFAARIKPFRNLPERETTLYAVLNELSFYHGECTLPENSMRWKVRDVLNDLENQRPGTKLQIANFYDRLKPFLVRDVGEKINYCRCGEPTSQDMCRTCRLLENLGVENE